MALSVLATVMCLVPACGSKGASGGSDSASPAGSSAAAAAKTGDSAKKSSARDFDKAKAVYDEVYSVKNFDPEPKKIEAMKAKLGAPDGTKGDASLWYAVEKGNNCFEFSCSPTGGSGYQMTDKSKCGL